MKRLLKILGIGLLSVVGLFIVLVVIAIAADTDNQGSAAAPAAPTSTPIPTAVPTPTAIPTATAVPTPTPTFDQIKASAATIAYDDLFRYNESHVGKQVFYKAEIVQVMETDGDLALRADVTEGEHGFWDDTVLLKYENAPVRLLEDDIVEFVATVDGLITYEAVLGNDITIPSLEVTQLRIVE